MIELAILNCVCQKRDFSALVKFGLADSRNFIEQRCAYEFIEKHLAEYGELPSVATVIQNCPDFEDVEVVESIETLCRKLTERNIKASLKETIQDVAKEFGDKDAYTLLEKVRDSVSKLDRVAKSKANAGVNWAVNGEDRWNDYIGRKSKDFTKKVPILFDEVSALLGGAERGSYVTFMAFTGRGKTWLGLLQALVTNRAGFKTLVESAEMSKEETQFRLDTLDAGFSNRGLYTGKLDYVQEQMYEEYLREFKSGTGRPDLFIKTAEDWKEGLTLSQIEYDIDQTGADVVVIDHFGLCRFRSSKREDKEDFSRQLKQLAARKQVVIIVLYQTNGDYERSKGKTDDGGVRELQCPTRKDYSGTISVIQDSDIIIGFDSVTWFDPQERKQRGKALLLIDKSRSGGGEGFEAEVDFSPNDGVLRMRQATDIF